MAADGSKSQEDNASANFLYKRTVKTGDVPSDQVLTLVISEKSFLQTDPSKLSSNREVVSTEPTGDHEISDAKDLPEPTGDHEISNAKDLHEVMMNGEVGSPQSRGVTNKLGGKDNSISNGNKSFAFGPTGQNNGFLKVKYFIFLLVG